MRKALLLLAFLTGFITGCEDKYKDVGPDAMGYSYYPLAVGDYRIYNVTDIKFKFNVGDTTRFQMRERVDTSFYDQTQTLNYKIVRSIRQNPNATWEDDSVMVVAKLDGMVLLTKDNTKYVKLVFPIREGVEFVGDAYNDHLYNDSVVPVRGTKIRNEKELYTYENVGAPYTTAAQTFPNTITVVQNGPNSYQVRLDKRHEVYAENVGLVYRVFNRVVIADCTPDNCNYGENYKLDGHERHEELISYGKM